LTFDNYLLLLAGIPASKGDGESGEVVEKVEASVLFGGGKVRKSQVVASPE